MSALLVKKYSLRRLISYNYEPFHSWTVYQTRKVFFSARVAACIDVDYTVLRALQNARNLVTYPQVVAGTPLMLQLHLAAAVLAFQPPAAGINPTIRYFMPLRKKLFQHVFAVLL